VQASHGFVIIGPGTRFHFAFIAKKVEQLLNKLDSSWKDDLNKKDRVFTI